MGIHKQMAKFIIREKKYLPIRGTVLLIGRQTIWMTPEQFAALVKDEGLTINSTIPVSIDNVTRSGAGRGFISDTYFFKALGADKVVALDVSDYEGADIVHDLGEPIPSDLEDKFDFVCNGSVLDNMFNPIMGLTNISRMVAPKGRVVHFEHASNSTNDAYLQFSPNWFFDYYAANRYTDCKTYIAFFSDLNGPWEFFACLHEGKSEPTMKHSAQLSMTAVVAEKSSDSTWNKFPIQGQYRSQKDWDEFLGFQQRFDASLRPLITPVPPHPFFPPPRGLLFMGTYC